MSDLDLLRPTLAFAAVVETGSFRAAAERLDLSPPYVSQLVSDLEARLGRQLLYRSTRKIALTADGETYVAHAQAMSQAFQSGIDAVRKDRTRLTGSLRVSAPTVLATPAFAKVLTGFTQRHPALRVSIDLDDRAVDPVAGRVDLAIRIGDPGDDPRLARKLFATRGVVCCAQGLATRLRDPADLETLAWLRSPAMPATLSLTGAGGKTATIAPAVQTVVNNASLIRSMLAAGAGFAVLPEFSIREGLAQGAYAVAMPAWSIPSVPVSVLFTERRTALTNARAFVDHVRASLARNRP